MGHLDVTAIISKGFNFYFPMLICLLSIGTFFRLGSRCLHACGIRQFFDDDDLSGEYVEDGKALMRRGSSEKKTIKNFNFRKILFFKNVEIVVQVIHYQIQQQLHNVVIEEEN